MDGERKFVLLIVGVTIVCITILYVLLFISLWSYRVYVGGSLLALLILAVIVFLRGRLIEQDVRSTRYRHHEEIPLDAQGEAHYWPQWAQTNPHRLVSPAHASQPTQPYRPYESGYQSFGGEDEWMHRPIP